jgi:IMP dehydrogenase
MSEIWRGGSTPLISIERNNMDDLKWNKYLVDNDNGMGLEFDDFYLIPQPSEVNSRDIVDTSIDLGRVHLDVPIIASPMKGITTTDLITKVSEFGAIGLFHRFYNSDIKKYADYEFCDKNVPNWGLSIGLDEKDHSSWASFNPPIVCIDVANGYLRSVIDKTYEVKSYIEKHGLNTLLMVGNVVTREGVLNLASAGADLIRVGIGSGNLCTTRNVTGVGMPQASALFECAFEVAHRNIDVRIVADGGIRSSGDAVKAFACGADLVMMGSLFGQTFESGTKENGGIMYGMASRQLQEEYYHVTKSVEGISKVVEQKQSVTDFLSEFTYGIKSACTYLNIEKLSKIKFYSEIIERASIA